MTSAVRVCFYSLDQKVLVSTEVSFPQYYMFYCTTLPSNALALYVFVDACKEEITSQIVCTVCVCGCLYRGNNITDCLPLFRLEHCTVVRATNKVRIQIQTTAHVEWDNKIERERWTLDIPAHTHKHTHTHTQTLKYVCCRWDYISHLLLPGILIVPPNEMASHINHTVMSCHLPSEETWELRRLFQKINLTVWCCFYTAPSLKDCSMSLWSAFILFAQGESKVTDKTDATQC